MKMYNLRLTNKSEYLINEDQKNKIRDTASGWISLPNGTLVNKSYIIEMSYDIDATRNTLGDEVKDKELPPVIDMKEIEEMKKSLLSRFVDKIN